MNSPRKQQTRCSEPIRCGTGTSWRCCWLATAASLLTPHQVMAEFPGEALARLPKSTVAAVVSDHARRTRDHLLQTGVMQIIRSDDFLPFRQALERSEVELGHWLSEFPLPWDEAYALLPERSLAVAILETESQLPEQCFLIDASENIDSWLKLTDQFAQQATAAGAAVTRKQIDAFPTWLITPADGTNPVALMRMDHWLVIGSSEDCLKQWLEADTASLQDDQRYVRTIGQLQEPFAKQGDVWIFVDPLRLDYLGSRAAGQDLDSFSQTFGARHGFDAIKSVGGVATIGGSAYDAAYRMKVWVSNSVEGNGMQLLNWQTMQDPRPGEWVPGGISTYTTMDWDLRPILAHIGPLFDDVIRETTGRSEQTFEALLKEIEKDIGVDLQEDLLSLLGPRVEMISVFTPPASKTSEQSVVAIEITDPQDDAEVADLLYALLEDDANNFPFSVPGMPFELWKLGAGQRAGDRTAGFSTPGAMVAHQRLFFASSYSTLYDHVAVRKQKSSAGQDPEFMELSKRLTAIAGSTPSIRTLASPARDFENTYELLRTGRVEGAESIYAQIIEPFMQQSETEVPFELLPPFAVLRDSLGGAGIQLNVVDDGWDIWGINLRVHSEGSP